MKVLVCGGRNYDNWFKVKETLDKIRGDFKTLFIIHGDAAGADSLAGRWATEKGVQEVKCPANWRYHFKSAGPIRNRAMLDLNPDLVISFPGGAGTAHMVDISKKRGVQVWEIKDDAFCNS